jgi:ribonuclease BN (tRNA processing enzyme)
MLLTVLGCSGSAPGPDRPSSGYLVEANGRKLVVDLGTGTLAALSAGHDPFDVDALLFSHLHPDHCADVGTLTVVLRYRLDPPYDIATRPLPVYAPADAHERFAAAFAPSAADLADTDLTDTYDFRPIGPDPMEIAGFTVTAVPVDHPCEAYGFRIEGDGTSLCYTGDTGPCDALTGLARGADLLLAEATWTDRADRPAGVHLSGRQAGELADRAGARKLVLTHQAPWTDRSAVLAEARAVYAGPVELAEPYAVYEI